MRIVVLDGATLNPGDLSWAPLAALGDLTVYDRTRPEELDARLDGAEVALTNETGLNREALQRARSLRFIAIMATGFNVVDVAAARELGIDVSNAPGYSTDAVAQLAVSLMLETAFHVGEHSRAVHAGRWVTSPDYCFWDYPLFELAGKTLGILGCGAIGMRLARFANAFGMTVLGYSRRETPGTARDGVTFVTLDALFSRSQFLSLHCPLNAESAGIVNAANLAKMPRGAVLVNTSRGACVVAEDVVAALESGQLGWYCSDVSTVEPMAADDPYLGQPHCILTPHLAWATEEARRRLMDICVDNVRAYACGAPVNLVN